MSAAQGQRGVRTSTEGQLSGPSFVSLRSLRNRGLRSLRNRGLRSLKNRESRSLRNRGLRSVRSMRHE